MSGGPAVETAPEEPGGHKTCLHRPEFIRLLPRSCPHTQPCYTAGTESTLVFPPVVEVGGCAPHVAAGWYSRGGSEPRVEWTAVRDVAGRPRR
ncbi:MAG TPA: hypothetical protein VF792_07960, partial [Ktedonobacterales bacterium]